MHGVFGNSLESQCLMMSDVIKYHQIYFQTIDLPAHTLHKTQTVYMNEWLHQYCMTAPHSKIGCSNNRKRLLKKQLPSLGKLGNKLGQEL